ncbi:MAG: hypothetical protein ACE5JG_04070, partial [Planctomycetota bacterium]
MRRVAVPAAVLVLASLAGAFLISSAPVGGRFAFEFLIPARRPLTLRVDTEAVPGVADPRAVAQALMNTWNAIPEAQAVFGSALAGAPYNGANVGITFGRFPVGGDGIHEIAWDADGSIMSFFGATPSTLGLTIKSVILSSGRIEDVLVVINTRSSALTPPPGSGATAEQLLRSTLLHELGHATGIAHTPVGMTNTTSQSFGLERAQPSEMPTMYAFRIPNFPQEGITLEQDDLAALIQIYPAGLGGRGSISGSVRGLSGAGANEIAVRAVSGSGSNDVHVGVLTNADGTDQGAFVIPHVPPGGYRVLIETVNGRSSIDASVLDNNGLGSAPFGPAVDEYWEPGDTYDPAADVTTSFATVQVRAGRDTGSIDFVLNAEPIAGGQALARAFASTDARTQDAFGRFHFVDLYVFGGRAGELATLNATAPPGGVTPQLRLLRPSDFSLEVSHEPPSGNAAVINKVLEQTGTYTVAVLSAAAVGQARDTGSYTLSLSGSGSGLPPPPAVTGAALAPGAANPPARSLASPVCTLGMLQVELRAPSHEELWVVAVAVRSSGPGDARLDGTPVRRYRDGDGSGTVSGGDALLGSGTFNADDGTLTIQNLDLELNPGATTDLLVVYDIAVQSVVSVPQLSGSFAWLGALPLLLLAPWLRPRRRSGAVLLALLLCLPLASCSGGGSEGSSPCNNPFDPAGAVVTFQCRVDSADVVAFTPTTDPAAPLSFPAQTFSSATLRVS